MSNSKDRIIESTASIMGKEGINCSMTLITKDVGCSETLIYRYFKSRKNLTSVCFDTICREIKTRIQAIQFPSTINDDSFRRYVRDVWEEYYNYIEDNPEKGSFYVQYAWFMRPFPSNDSTPVDIVKRVLGKKIDILNGANEHYVPILSHLVTIVNVVMISKKNKWMNEKEISSDELFDLITNGIFNKINK